MALDLVVAAPRAVVDGAERGCVVGILDGRIAAVEPYGTELDAAQTVRLDGDVVLLPGLVDTHVHVNEPGRTDWEGFAHATRAAAAGGVTTIVDMPLNSVPPTLDLAALETKRLAAQGSAYVDVGFWGGAVPDNRHDLQALWEAGVFGFKCFLADSGVEEFPALDEAALRATAEVVASFGGLLLVHAEDPDSIHGVPPGTSYAEFAASRPESGEVAAVRAVIETSRATGCRMHVVHLAAGSALPLLHAAHDAGVPVTAETCPHYLTFAADEVPAGATAFKCCPPIRGADNRDRLWEGLANGTIGTVVSDHSPCPADLKALDTGDFAAAWGGISSLQLGLAAVWTGARDSGRGLPDVVRWMATGPANRVGLSRKGRISVGADADLCVLAPDESFVVDPATLQHRHPVTPYAGRTLVGVVRETWLAGHRIDPDEEPRGRLLSRGAPR
jgi:allantoinase